MTTPVPASAPAQGPTLLDAVRLRRQEAVTSGLSRRRRLLAVAVALVLFALAWELFKWLGGDPWRLHGTVAGIEVDYEHVPPFHWALASDLALPHLWSILGAFPAPYQRFGDPTWLVLLEAAAYTFKEAFVGFVIGAGLGLLLGIVFVRYRLLERAFSPYVVASQAVPLITIAPIIVIFFGNAWTSVALIAAYLSFFPVTVAALRGLRSADPRAFEFFRSAAATDRQVLTKLQLPSSVPYLFAGFRIAAAAAVVGAIIGELPNGLPDGVGGQILQASQYYITGPERLWASMVVAAALGLLSVGLVWLAERLVTRGRYRSAEV
jgi:NitT/TauT family transport system permease protein